MAFTADLAHDDESGLVSLGLIHDDFVGDAGVNVHLGGDARLPGLLAERRKQLLAGFLHFVQEMGPLPPGQAADFIQGRLNIPLYQ